ncbi:Uncharacterised protein [Vibrio cholerae]|uniref:Uncharacterized protein n=1 Tax=Vibrio cholerae TaxID=666 RepID=A0A656A7L6_VIBCL|nr:Uncharacterised protein [Vibrio cholerae]CRZ85759.1 Uncharacterised protein [Vibrio cholerae]CSA02090.1 Uncharacterised protein [Vibrio cholerae]CSA93806.1 Uncharacterised protein [Vibrio cholerae]CSB93885.1 Uncharacterised protein [Vibrio cholerae]
MRQPCLLTTDKGAVIRLGNNIHQRQLPALLNGWQNMRIAHRRREGDRFYLLTKLGKGAR